MPEFLYIWTIDIHIGKGETFDFWLAQLLLYVILFRFLERVKVAIDRRKKGNDQTESVCMFTWIRDHSEKVIGGGGLSIFANEIWVLPSPPEDWQNLGAGFAESGYILITPLYVVYGLI